MPSKPKIGAYVLETLTTGMYREPLDTVREYVQNAADSLRDAQRQSILSRNEGRIEAEISVTDRRFILKDNGTGIPAESVEARLLNIGMSDKLIGQSAGFRGIGRLAGIAYCDRLSFRTTARGEAEETTISIDCAAVRDAITPAKRQVEELAEVLLRLSETSTRKAAKVDHYFHVIMEGVNPKTGAHFLDWQLLERYLGQVAPVEYDAQRFVFASKIRQFMNDHDLAMPVCTLIVKGGGVEHQVFKPYRGRYVSSGRGGGAVLSFDIKDIRFYPEEPNPESAYWLWYGVSDLVGSIDDERVAGFRLRKYNIALDGADRMAELFEATAKSNRRFNGYFIGEVHVQCPNAIPNARRDGFEDVGSWPEIKELLHPFIEERCADVRRASSIRSQPVPKVVHAAQTVLDRANDRLKHGLASKSERDNLLEKVGDQLARVMQTQEREAANGKTKELIQVAAKLQSVQRSLANEENYIFKKVSSSLSRKERAVVQEAIEAVQEVMESMSCAGREECFKKVRDAILDKFNGKKGK